MDFGPVPTRDAEGGILAHSLKLGSLVLKKGRVLRPADIAALVDAQVPEVTIARLAPDDLHEDDAAQMLAQALVPETDRGLRLTVPVTGRVNLYATHTGLVQIEKTAIAAINRVDPSITLATLPDLARVEAGTLIATIKIIPYGVARADIERACTFAASAIRTLKVQRRTASLILTQTKGQATRLLKKGAEAVESRLTALGIDLVQTQIVAHDARALAVALQDSTAAMTLVLTGSATSDVRDTGPSALVQAGGTLTRFGIPVDPGNLLFLGELNGRPVIGLPGCARSPALNGADWVLERIACGLVVRDADMAAMAVGGLLKEIPSRPQPREQRS